MAMSFSANRKCFKYSLNDLGVADKLERDDILISPQLSLKTYNAINTGINTSSHKNTGCAKDILLKKLILSYCFSEEEFKSLLVGVELLPSFPSS